ncbi:CHAP domain-containing protein [Rhodococcus sp. 3-2]|uniref:CHAP domain-containing protein n=1 Tax=Rhodococcus sp. 3-2 TaxID=2890836 RepID=UPI001D1851D1|nr:CHAP domain-containing protein [Rhodococcus sp. 3-2]MCC4306267.1 CHAP domain-containing protein [Rhodococcus sp. 3-2]
MTIISHREATSPHLAERALRSVSMLMALLTAAIGIALIGSPSAHADTRVVTVNTGAGNINVRAAATTQSQILRTIANRTRVSITCYVRGETFSGGPYRVSTNVWNRLDTGGYVTDAMLETGSNNPVVPLCSSSPASSTPGSAMGQTRAANTGAAGNCTWGAYNKWFNASGGRHYPALSGNAKDWANSARATGWTVVLDAQPRSMVVFQPGVQSADRTYGHVAWVDSTARRADGLYVTITEMNGAAGFNKWSTRTVKDVVGMSYILLP